MGDMKGRSLWIPLALSMSIVLFLLPAVFVLAQTIAPSSTTETVDVDPNIKDQVDQIQSQVKTKEQSVHALDDLISQYQNRLSQQADAGSTLQSQLTALDQAAQQQTLQIQRAQTELDALALKTQALDVEISHQNSTLTVRRALLSDMLARLATSDEPSPLLSMLSEGSLSAFASRREELRALELSLTQMITDVEVAQQVLNAQKSQLQTAELAKRTEQTQLALAKTSLDEQIAAKQSLLFQTHNREDQYQGILSDLRRNQQTESDDITALRNRLQGTIDSSDESLAAGSVLLSWPIDPLKGISAHFHDQSYPFKNLFEHPGIDLPTPVGTPVKAAAGGYVAWNRTGKQYGNYIMVIHPNGIATIYAHLSAFVAKPDSYVERGDIIGYSGGRPGDAGAGLSTGAHLHFEVRQDGIPVNPEPFLPDLNSTP